MYYLTALVWGALLKNLSNSKVSPGFGAWGLVYTRAFRRIVLENSVLHAYIYI